MSDTEEEVRHARFLSLKTTTFGVSVGLLCLLFPGWLKLELLD